MKEESFDKTEQKPYEGKDIDTAMTRDQRRDKFLVEVGEGGCWHEWEVKYFPDPIPFSFEKNKTISLFICKHCNWQESKKWIPNPDFNRPENFIRLLEIGEKHKLEIRIHTINKEIWVINKEHALCNKNQINNTYDSVTDIPRITADLIAKALGFKEAE